MSTNNSEAIVLQANSHISSINRLLKSIKSKVSADFICSNNKEIGTKLDALTKQWDVYPKGGNTGYATVNPHNFKPIFTQEQLTASVRATILLFSSLCTATVVNLDTLYQDILLALLSDPIATKYISTDGQ